MQMIHTPACHSQGLIGLSVDPILTLLTVTLFNVCQTNKQTAVKLITWFNTQKEQCQSDIPIKQLTECSLVEHGRQHLL